MRINIMSESKKKTIYVVGHKNPDTDSICSAIALANLKNELVKQKEEKGDLTARIYKEAIPENVVFKPVRAGHIAPETRYVLDTFGAEVPAYLADARTQITDLDYNVITTARENISLRNAWMIMRDIRKSTLAITDDARHLKGIITTSDIAKSYMSALDNTILGVAKTPYANILDTLDATMVVGNPDGIVTEGKVMIAAANTEQMRSVTGKGDVVILGNRYEAQLCAIEAGASMIIVCENAPVTRTIRKLAEAADCTILNTPFDTYTASRLINTSMPIGYFMTKDILLFNEKEYIDDIKTIMTKERHRDFPIVSEGNVFEGMISRRNLINMDKKRFVLVDHNEESQAMAHMETAEIVEIVDHHKLGTMETMKPVTIRNMPVGCTATIVYLMYMESRIEIAPQIAGLLCSAIISDTLLFRSPTCTPLDKMACIKLAEIAGVDPEKHAIAMFDAGSDLKGKSIEDIFYQDFKKFKAGDLTFGVGQITAMSMSAFDEIKEPMKAFIKHNRANEGTDMLFFLFTDILAETSCVVFTGNSADEALEGGFDKKVDAQEVTLPGVVSRKKQFVPNIMEQFQN